MNNGLSESEMFQSFIYSFSGMVDKSMSFNKYVNVLNNAIDRVNHSYRDYKIDLNLNREKEKQMKLSGIITIRYNMDFDNEYVKSLCIYIVKDVKRNLFSTIISVYPDISNTIIYSSIDNDPADKIYMDLQKILEHSIEIIRYNFHN